MIRDWLLPLGLDTNHGYAKMPTANSEAEKKRTTLERRLDNARRWGEHARLASLMAQKTSDRRWKKAKEHSRELYAELNREMFELDAQGVSEREYRAGKRELVAAVEAEMGGNWRSSYRAFDSCNREYAKWERYCQDQREILRVLEDLHSAERRMYQLDDPKDQVMTGLKLAVANPAMWARDNYFPPDYANATWQRLAPFFRLPGQVVLTPDTMSVEMKRFNDRGLNRDLVAVCARVAALQSRLPNGRVIVPTVANQGVSDHPQSTGERSAA